MGPKVEGEEEEEEEEEESPITNSVSGNVILVAHCRCDCVLQYNYPNRLNRFPSRTYQEISNSVTNRCG